MGRGGNCPPHFSYEGTTGHTLQGDGAHVGAGPCCVGARQTIPAEIEKEKLMSHYALLNNNYVVMVVVGSTDDQEADFAELFGLACKRTSYNTRGGVHINGSTPFRKNYAGIGYTYDSVRDAFIPPKPYASWSLNEDSCLWEPPTPMPTTGFYHWNEDTLTWDEV